MAKFLKSPLSNIWPFLLLIVLCSLAKSFPKDIFLHRSLCSLFSLTLAILALTLLLRKRIQAASVIFIALLLWTQLFLQTRVRMAQKANPSSIHSNKHIHENDSIYSQGMAS